MNHNWQKRMQIYKMAADNGINVALTNAENSKTYKVFHTQVETGLYDQIKYVADYKDTLPLLMSLAKSASAELFAQVSSIVSKISLADKIDLPGFLVWAGTQGGQSSLDKLGIYGVFGLKNQALVDYFKDYSNLRISTVDDYTKKWISETIQKGKDEGLTPFQIQQKLIDDGQAITKLRAERIVLSETSRAMTLVENESARRYGIKEHIWRTSRDERVCPICMPLEGEKVEVGKSYSGGISGPPAHIVCRCFQEDVIPKDWQEPAKPWLGE